MTDLIVTQAPERRTKPGLMPSLIDPSWTAGRTQPRDGWYAEVSVNGLDLQLSRFDDEPEWTIDAAFGDSGFPMWANGYGARYLLTKTLKADLGRQVDLHLAVAARP